MKKKSLIALLLACSFAFGTASMAGCNLLPGMGDGNTDQTIDGTGGDKEENKDGTGGGTAEHEHTYSDTYTSAGASGHYKMATCGHTSEHTKSEPHVYDNDADTTCNECGYVRTVDDGKEEDNDKDKTVAVNGITLSLSEKTLEIGGSVQLTAQVSPSGATKKTVTWHSSDTAVATVEDGLVKAVAAGTANITAKSTDGSNVTSAACVIKVNAAVVPVKTYTVTFISEGKTVASETVEENTAVTAPSDVTKNGYFLVGWFTGENSGDRYDFNQKVTGNKTLYARWEQLSEALTYSYAGSECAAFEWGDTNPAGAVVKYKLSTANEYQTVDGALVRASSTSGVARVDIVGLKKNSNYDFQITTSSNKVITVTGMTISAYDRSGYAHFNYTSGVGAYKDDGTPKSNANIVYVTEKTKNNDFVVENKTYKGIVGVLRGAKNLSKPLIVRVIGTVGAATWSKIDYNADNKYSAKNKIAKTEIKGLNGKQLPQAKTSQADLIKGGYNTLNDSVYSELIGLESNLLNSTSEYDSCWNDCPIESASNITVEGIGEDATIFQWGMTFKKCNSIEVRNLSFDDYTEDACSFEGGTESSTSASGFDSKNYWVHHNTFEEGINYWDVCSEQDKHDGDGSTDLKRVSYVTFAYNIYNKTHKTGLVGSDNNVYTSSVTFHHNVYNKCKARLPLARQANMHMYNNYYNGTTSTDLSLRAHAYALVENCYFESENNCPVELQFEAGSDSKNNENVDRWGAAKLIGCVINQSKISVSSSITANALYVGNDRLAQVVSGNKYGENFDTNSSLFYYDATNKKTKVEVAMLTAEQVKTEVPKLAGVQKRNGTTGGGSTGGETEEPNPTPTPNPSETLTNSVNVVGAKTANTVLLEVKNGGSTVARATLVPSGTEKNGGTLVESDGASASAEGHIQVDAVGALSIELAAGYTYSVTIYAGSSSTTDAREITIDGVKLTTGVGASCKALTWNLSAGTYTSTETNKIRIAKIVIVATPV